MKHLLYNNGITYPDCFENSRSHWSNRFIYWLENEVSLLSSTGLSLDLLIDQVKLFRKNLLKATRLIRDLSQKTQYSQQYENLLSIPGVGVVTAMCLLTEVEMCQDFTTKENLRLSLAWFHLAIVVVRILSIQKTFRGNKHLGTLVIESAWISIRYDKAMSMAYGEYCKRMKGQEAIIRIARKCRIGF